LVLRAIADTVQRYEISPELLWDLIDGVARDLEPRGFATFHDELFDYCFQVASTVGLTCISIWGYSDRAYQEPATYCGVAFQMTNILRDLREDAARGRCYLPLTELSQFGVEEKELGRGKWTPQIAELLEYQFERTEKLYRCGEETQQFLSRDGCRIFP